MSQYQQKLSSLVEKLVNGTNSGNIDWKTDNGSAVYAVLPSGMVEVKTDRDDTGQEAIRITVFDKGGNVSVTFDDTDVVKVDFVGKRVPVYPSMKDLFDSALRYAKGEDEVLNNILSDLDDLNIPF